METIVEYPPGDSRIKQLRDVVIQTDAGVTIHFEVCQCVGYAIDTAGELITIIVPGPEGVITEQWPIT